jgi:hypothetical protein
MTCTPIISTVQPELTPPFLRVAMFSKMLAWLSVQSSALRSTAAIVVRDGSSSSGRHVMSLFTASFRHRSSLPWPDGQGAVGAAILAGLLEGETHLLTRMQLPVASHLDAGEVDETAARHLRSVYDTPAFVGVEPLHRTCHCTRLRGGLPCHGLIMPCERFPGASQSCAGPCAPALTCGCRERVIPRQTAPTLETVKHHLKPIRRRSVGPRSALPERFEWAVTRVPPELTGQG